MYIKYANLHCSRSRILCRPIKQRSERKCLFAWTCREGNELRLFYIYLLYSQRGVRCRISFWAANQLPRSNDDLSWFRGERTKQRTMTHPFFTFLFFSLSFLLSVVFSFFLSFHLFFTLHFLIEGMTLPFFILLFLFLISVNVDAFILWFLLSSIVILLSFFLASISSLHSRLSFYYFFLYFSSGVACILPSFFSSFFLLYFPYYLSFQFPSSLLYIVRLPFYFHSSSLFQISFPCFTSKVKFTVSPSRSRPSRYSNQVAAFSSTLAAQNFCS